MNYILIGRRIREYRVRRSLSQAELAERVALSAAYIGFIENARKHPSLSALVKIATVLDTSVDSLLTGYQKCDTMQYTSDFLTLIGDCSIDEKYILYKMLEAMKSVLRDGFPVLNEDER